MRSPLKIGEKEYKTKKDAIAYYRAILNYYDFGESLNEDDIDDIIDLLNYNYSNYLASLDEIAENNTEEQLELGLNDEIKITDNETDEVIQEELAMRRDAERKMCIDGIKSLKNTLYEFYEIGLDTSDIETQIELLESRLAELGEEMECDEPEIPEIIDIKIARVQFNTKCFEVFYSDNTSEIISYLMMINNKGYSQEEKFSKACRNSVQNDIRAVKQEYFDKNSVKGQVKCQETGILSKWEELVVDHRQPNTLSVIIDRFKEKYNIELDEIEYTSNEQNHLVFKDDNLAEQFREYHKEKANLRIVRTECNSSRTSLAKIKRTSKDLTVK